LPPDVGITVAGAEHYRNRKVTGCEPGSRLTLLNRFIEDDETARLLQQAGVLALPYLQRHNPACL